eukprot:7110425-Prymnesium_polylepis.2
MQSCHFAEWLKYTQFESSRQPAKQAVASSYVALTSLRTRELGVLCSRQQDAGKAYLSNSSGGGDGGRSTTAVGCTTTNPSFDASE